MMQWMGKLHSMKDCGENATKALDGSDNTEDSEDCIDFIELYKNQLLIAGILLLVVIWTFGVCIIVKSGCGNKTQHRQNRRTGKSKSKSPLYDLDMPPSYSTVMRNGQKFPVITPEVEDEKDLRSRMDTMVVVSENTNGVKSAQNIVTSIVSTSTGNERGLEQSRQCKKSAPSVSSLPGYHDAVKELEKKSDQPKKMDYLNLRPMPPSYGEFHTYDVSESEAEEGQYSVSLLNENDI